MDDISEGAAPPRLNAAEIGAIAHLYRAELYRSTIWRTRLDATTNWAVVTTGIALSAVFADAHSSPLPLVLVGLLVVVFLVFEARRYRYFDVWRVRARVLETQFYAPMLRAEIPQGRDWHKLLAQDYAYPQYHLSTSEAIGRRLRRNYSYILGIQAVAYYGKLAIHPTPITTLEDVWVRAAVGPIPGELMVLAGILFHGSWVAFALFTLRRQTHRRRALRAGRSGDPIRDLVARRA